MRRPRIGVRSGLVLAALAVMLVASVVRGREKPAVEIVAPAIPAAQRSARAAAAADLDLRRLRRARRDEAPPVDLFAAAAPPADARGSAGARRSRPPALPFTYLGKMIEGGKVSVFLDAGGTNYSVRPGQTLAKNYRVDRISAGAITFTYLPTRTRRVLAIPQLD